MLNSEVKIFAIIFLMFVLLFGCVSKSQNTVGSITPNDISKISVKEIRIKFGPVISNVMKNIYWVDLNGIMHIWNWETKVEKIEQNKEVISLLSSKGANTAISPSGNYFAYPEIGAFMLYNRDTNKTILICASSKLLYLDDNYIAFMSDTPLGQYPIVFELDKMRQIKECLGGREIKIENLTNNDIIAGLKPGEIGVAIDSDVYGGSFNSQWVKVRSSQFVIRYWFDPEPKVGGDIKVLSDPLIEKYSEIINNPPVKELPDKNVIHDETKVELRWGGSYNGKYAIVRDNGSGYWAYFYNPNIDELPRSFNENRCFCEIEHGYGTWFDAGQIIGSYKNYVVVAGYIPSETGCSYTAPVTENSYHYLLMDLEKPSVCQDLGLKQYNVSNIEMSGSVLHWEDSRNRECTQSGSFCKGDWEPYLMFIGGE